MGLCASNAVAAKPNAEAGTDEDPPVKSFGRKKGPNSRRDSIAYNKAAMEKRDAANDPASRAPAAMVQEVN